MSYSVGFIGLGLIGGSIAKALKKADKNIRIVAYNRSPAPLEMAVADGVVDVPTHEIGEAFRECDIIYLCTPVEYNSIYLKQVAEFRKPGCILTDVGSVKGYIHETVRELGLEACFIGGHPMAGSEKTGYAAANELILENAYYAITPTVSTSSDALNFYTKLVHMMKAIPIVVEPQKHDFAVAGISHVPHLIAAGLVNTVHDSDTDDELMHLLAAGGFKDITRIASSSADMWSQICSTNTSQILLMMDRYIDYMKMLRNTIAHGNFDAIHKVFEDSKEYRDSIGLNKGLVLPSFHILVDSEDREGVISEITGLLSDKHISIKNIEIIHNREYKQGAILLAFYDEATLSEATNILHDCGYVTH